MHFSLFRTTLQSYLFLGHLLLYFTLVHFLGVGIPLRRLTLKIALGVLFLSLIPASFLASRYSTLWVRCFYTAAASWVGIVYLFVLASIVCWTLYGLAKLFHLLINKKILIVVLMGMALIASLYGFINSGVTRITRITLPLHNLPSQWKGKHAVWVSDTHLGPVRNNRFAQHIATMIQNLKPDIVFIGGDLFDGESVEPMTGILFAREGLSPEVGNETGNKVTVLNPEGKRPPIALVPMALRLSSLMGKTVYFVDVRFMNGDVLLKEMQKVFVERYPGVKTKFRRKQGEYTEDDPKVWAEIKEKGGVMVMAIGH